MNINDLMSVEEALQYAEDWNLEFSDCQYRKLDWWRVVPRVLAEEVIRLRKELENTNERS